MSPFRFRFAPSPTGHLHVGHAYSAYLNLKAADYTGGQALFRLEDIDFTRCRPELVRDLEEDLDWVGYPISAESVRQSEHRDRYLALLTDFEERELIYPCFCTRSSLRTINGLYDGTCKALTTAQREAKKVNGELFSMRLDMTNALVDNKVKNRLATAGHLSDVASIDPSGLNDCILARKDIGISYHIAVVADDHSSTISHVIRGSDLREETPYHLILQALFGFDSPRYFHHCLVKDRTGSKLSKSKASPSLRQLRRDGLSHDALIDLLEDQAQRSGDWGRLQCWLDDSLGTKETPPAP